MNKIQTIAELEACYGPANTNSVLKELSFINDEYRALIEATPFFTIASIGDGGMDCSPRGDGPGSIHILNERTIAFADRRGNNRLDTLRNIVMDPRIALLAMIPGLNETLRINGNAYITDDAEQISAFAEHGKMPATIIVIEIETMYFQCARALKRARLWDIDAQVQRKTLPSTGDLIRSAIMGFDAEEYDAELQERQAKTLY